MDAITIDNRKFEIVETQQIEDAIIPKYIRDEEGLHEVIDWQENGVKVFALVEPSEAERERAIKERTELLAAEEEQAKIQQAAHEAEMDEWARSRGILK